MAVRRALAAKAATTTIPILFVSRDPVQDGLVASFSHPGGNVTGVVTLLDSPTKQLGLLRDLVPNAAIIAVLVNPDDSITGSWIKDIQATARAVAQPKPPHGGGLRPVLTASTRDA